MARISRPQNIVSCKRLNLSTGHNAPDQPDSRGHYAYYELPARLFLNESLNEFQKPVCNKPVLFGHRKQLVPPQEFYKNLLLRRVK